jgi:hypothetical protein
MVYFVVLEGNILWIDSFVTTIALLGLHRLLKGNAGFITGLVFGGFLLFKQHGIFLCLTGSLWAFFNTKSIYSMIKFTLGWFMPLSLVFLYVLNLGVFKDFFYWGFLHNLQGYVGVEGKPPSLGQIIKFLSIFLPGFFGITFYSGHLKRHLIVFFFASLFFLFPRFELLHSQVGLPMASLGLYLLLSSASKFTKSAGLFSLLVGIMFFIRFILMDDQGVIKFYENDYINKVNYIKTITDFQKSTYIFGVGDNFYHLSNTLPPNKLWIGLLPGNMLAWVQKILVDNLISDPPQYILVNPLAEIDDTPLTDVAPIIWSYISSHYFHEQRLLPNLELWRPINHLTYGPAY